MRAANAIDRITELLDRADPETTTASMHPAARPTLADLAIAAAELDSLVASSPGPGCEQRRST